MPEETNLVRLQKALANAGVASRRACEELITRGAVKVNGKLVTELGTKIDVEFVQGENADVRRNKVVDAINQRFGQHGVVAQNNGNGVSLVSDGRNMSVWFNSNVKDLSADSFGLDQGGAVAQVSRISLDGTVTTTDAAQVIINGVTITSANPAAATADSLATALETAINAAISSGALKNISVAP